MKQSRPTPPAAPVPPVRAPGFSLVELLVVIAIIGILAALLVGLAPAAMRRARESRVQTELRGIEAAIEGYKAKHGVYPPDGLVLNGTTPRRDSYGNLEVRPELNPLFYELTGVVVENELSPQGYFVPLGDEDATTPPRLQPSDLKRFFGRDGFVNAAPRDRKRTLYRAEFKDSASAEIFQSRNQAGYTDLHVLAVGWAGDAERPKGGTGLAWPRDDVRFPPPIPSNPRLNPWRYVSSNPTNNPGRFDLWAEYIENGQKKIIGNWKR